MKTRSILRALAREGVRPERYEERWTYRNGNPGEMIQYAATVGRLRITWFDSAGRAAALALRHLGDVSESQSDYCAEFYGWRLSWILDAARRSRAEHGDGWHEHRDPLIPSRVTVCNTAHEDEP